MKSLLQVEILIPWLAATAVAAATMVSYAYSVFETKDLSAFRAVGIEKRLDRIEAKIDALRK
jgi:hypothetical protein